MHGKLSFLCVLVVFDYSLSGYNENPALEIMLFELSLHVPSSKFKWFNRGYDRSSPFLLSRFSWEIYKEDENYLYREEITHTRGETKLLEEMHGNQSHLSVCNIFILLRN